MKTCSRQRGLSLIESLISTAIIGFGLMSLTRFQTVLIEETAYSREHTTAVQLIETRIETFRVFETISPQDGRLSYAAHIVSGNDATTLGHTIFDEQWSVTAHDQPGRFKTVTVVVEWTDARGMPRALESASLIVANDPRLLGSQSHATHPIGTPLRHLDRHTDIPVSAIDQGDGTSHFDPPGSGPGNDGPAIVFDNASGEILGVTAGDTENHHDGDVSDPTPDPSAYFLVFGYIGFDAGHPPAAANPESDIELELVDSAGTPLSGHVCWDDSATPAALRAFPAYISYACLVATNGLARIGGVDRAVWSGQVRLRLGAVATHPFGWGLTAADAKVCRYAATPEAYTDIHTTLGDQNYIVTRGDVNCPDGTMAALP